MTTAASGARRSRQSIHHSTHARAPVPGGRSQPRWSQPSSAMPLLHRAFWRTAPSPRFVTPPRHTPASPPSSPPPAHPLRTPFLPLPLPSSSSSFFPSPLSPFPPPFLS